MRSGLGPPNRRSICGAGKLPLGLPPAGEGLLRRDRQYRPLWRYAVAGDLPGFSGLIDRAALELLTAANSRRPVIAYTHKPVLDGEHPAAAANRRCIAEAIAGGFLVNLSANDPHHADALADLGLAPVVTILPHASMRAGAGRSDAASGNGARRSANTAIASLPCRPTPRRGGGSRSAR